MKIDKRSLRFATTAIGSLPHHNVDSALEYAFRFNIPFLPQIPLRSPWEYMIPQALEGFPGFLLTSSALPRIDLSIWSSKASKLQSQLDQFLKDHSQSEFFEPSPLSSACWKPFLFELSERKSVIAKVQIAGPFTVLGTLQSHEDSSPLYLHLAKHPDLSKQIFEFILARSIAMIEKIKELGAQPILFLDEPALFQLYSNRPRDQITFLELTAFIQALKQRGAWVGLHCCSDAEWGKLLSLPLDFLSIDTQLSSASLFKHSEALKSYEDRGGALYLGIIPTNQNIQIADLVLDDLLNNTRPAALITPACGLVMRSIEETEILFELLNHSAQTLRKTYPSSIKDPL